MKFEANIMRLSLAIETISSKDAGMTTNDPHLSLLDQTKAQDAVIDTRALIDPKSCQTMIEVRQGVDQLDQILVELLTRRQGFMDAAARIKPEFNHVRDNARIEDVVTKVIAHSLKSGLSPEISEPVWRLLIERCIAYEGEVWHRLRQEEA